MNQVELPFSTAPFHAGRSSKVMEVLLCKQTKTKTVSILAHSFDFFSFDNVTVWQHGARCRRINEKSSFVQIQFQADGTQESDWSGSALPRQRVIRLATRFQYFPSASQPIKAPSHISPSRILSSLYLKTTTSDGGIGTGRFVYFTAG